MARWIDRVGMGDGHGNLSFNKLVTAAMLGTFMFAICWSVVQLSLIPDWFVWSFGVVITGAGFGLKGFMVALEKRSEMYNAQTTTTVNADLAAIIKAVKARREDGDTEDTP